MSTDNKRPPFWEMVGVITVSATVLSLIFGLVYPIIASVRADGRVTYCYVNTDVYHVPSQPDAVMYTLWGHREWRFDALLSRNSKSLEEAKAAAATYGCELR